MEREFYFYDKFSTELFAQQITESRGYCVDMGTWFLMPYLKVVAPFDDGNCYEAVTYELKDGYVRVQFQDGDSRWVDPKDLVHIPVYRADSNVTKLIDLATPGLADPIFVQSDTLSKRTIKPVGSLGLSPEMQLAWRHPQEHLVCLGRLQKDLPAGTSMDEFIPVWCGTLKFGVKRKDLWLVYPNTLTVSVPDILNSWTTPMHGTVKGTSVVTITDVTEKRTREAARLGKEGDVWWWVWVKFYNDHRLVPHCNHAAFVPAKTHETAVIRAKSLWGPRLEMIYPYYKGKLEVKATLCMAHPIRENGRLLTILEGNRRETARIAKEWDHFRAELARMNSPAAPKLKLRMANVKPSKTKTT